MVGRERLRLQTESTPAISLQSTQFRHWLGVQFLPRSPHTGRSDALKRCLR
ncbi:hypothetical protein MSKU3_0469 [Komagataeibacter oboediens]|nr:hypothetical protein MSKU3_0469 [Komagataeibacter oboediens]